MKKFIIIIALIFTTPFAYAEDWSSVFKGYSDAEYGKTVSSDEFQSAIKTMEKFQKKDKKKKSKLDALKEEKKSPVITFDHPSRSEPLCLIHADVNYKGKVIERGFYLANSVYKDNQYFIRLSHGKGKVIADIAASSIKTETKESKVLSELIEGDILKLTYLDNNMVLEAYLWVH